MVNIVYRVRILVIRLKNIRHSDCRLRKTFRLKGKQILGDTFAEITPYQLYWNCKTGMNGNVLYTSTMLNILVLMENLFPSTPNTFLLQIIIMPHK